MPSSPANLYAGTSGWAYATWKPGFYPKDVSAKKFLAFYASQLTSVEVNYTFRTLPSVAQFEGWLTATPENFKFSFKAPQRITHFQRLRESEATVLEFLQSLQPAREAGKLGALLFQLPPNFKADNERLAAFLALPALASEKVAFEFRNESWFTDATYDVLRSHNAALCIAENDDLATPDVATATHRYYRLRRDGGYSAEELAAFAKKFAAMTRKGEVYVYFKHEDEPTGALNAQQMLHGATK